jgi:putative SOS response-associated peptidase YedK
MIERYSITASALALCDRFSIDNPEHYTARYKAAPTQLLPVITSSAPQGLSYFYWGTSPEWSKNKIPSEKMINLRNEYFDEKPALKRALKKSRCIIPADGFYAWKKVGKKTSIPYRFIMNSKEIFSFAGVWEEFEDTDGNEMHTFSIITIPADEMMGSITERMPVVLHKEQEQIWLNKESSEEELLALLKPPAKNEMNYYPVAPTISNTTQDLPSMIIPTPPADQHGNLTLFD